MTPLISIGYEGRNLDALIEQLKVSNVNTLVDVRLNAISRKPGLSKRRLAEALRAEGIRYLHSRDLRETPETTEKTFEPGRQVPERSMLRCWKLNRLCRPYSAFYGADGLGCSCTPVF